MKALTLTSTLIAVLSLSTFGESTASLTAKISAKEKELASLQQELASLKNELKTNSADSQSYTVKSGDTLSSIGRRFKVKTSELIAWNKISDPTKLGVGDALTIRSGAAVKPVEAKPAPAVAPAKTSSYKIEKGDTFYSIARTHKMTVAQLRDLNPEVSTHLITAGQSLTISGTPVARTVKITPKPVPKPASLAKTTVKKSPPASAKVTPPAPKKTSAIVSAKKAETPAPKKEAVAEVKEAPATAEAPKKEEKVAAKASVTSIILTNETTFDAFASKHGTNTDQLNALNGWNLPKATVLARGSEIYVPQ